MPFAVSNQLSPAQQAIAYVSFRADNVVGAPPLTSASHPDQHAWSNDHDVSFDWSGLSDLSGIGGYSYVLDRASGTVPDTSVDTSDTDVNYTDLADGEWTFHVRAVDRVGNWSSTVHYPVRIDTAPPGAPTISSDTHPDQNLWYADGDAIFDWTTPIDATSSVGGYSYVVDQTASTVPDANAETTYNSRAYGDLADGEWTFHVRAVDGAGNWGDPDHYRVRIDTAAPPAPTISSSSHPVEGSCYPEGAPDFSWSTPSDVSGVVGYSYALDSHAATIPDTETETSGNDVTLSGVADGDWYFHVRARDGAGTWGAADHYHICVDTPLVGPIVYDAHTVDDDASGESAGNGDGVVDCGEAVELDVALMNQGADAAEDLSGVISESDPYVDLTHNTSSSFPDVVGGASQTSADDFEIAVASGTPDGHVVAFGLDVSASNGGPWADSFEVVVSCERPDLVVADIGRPADPVDGQPVSFTIGVENQGDSSTAPWGAFGVACYVDGDSTPLDTDTISSLDAGVSTSAHCTWTATEGSHTIRAVVDPGGDTPELDENNNERSATVAVGAACNDPYEPNDAIGSGTALSYGATLTDLDICQAGDADVYAFTGSAEDKIVADVEAQSLGSALDSNLYLYGTDGATIIAQNDDLTGTDSRMTYVLPEHGTFYLVVLDADHPNEGGSDHFYHLSLVLDASDVGPIATYDHTIDDDDFDQSSGNGDGVINCGETVELTVELRNDGTDSALDVYGEMSESDPYVDLIYNRVSTYGDIPGGESRANANDFDLSVDSSTPHGHIIYFDVGVTASNGGPWSDTLELAVSCANSLPSQPSDPSPADGSTVADLDVALTWLGGDPDGDAVTYDVYLEARDATPDELVCDGVASTRCDVGTLTWDDRYDWYVVATDVHGGSTRGPTAGSWQFYTPSPPVGPLTYVSHRVLDDGYWGPGDGDGVLACGEATKLPVTLRNQGGYTATAVTGSVVAPLDPYVTVIDWGSSAYPDLPGRAVAENGVWDTIAFAVSADAPDGHTIHFELETDAAFHGPWYDAFDTQVVCPRPDLTVTDIRADPAEARDGEGVDFTVEVTNRGDRAVAPGDDVEVSCHLDGSGTPFDSQSVSTGLAVDASTVVTCPWTAVEGARAVTATVDAGDLISESDESNNTGTLAFLVGAGCGDPYEPNDDWGQAERLDPGDRLGGANICPAGDEDVYQVVSALAGTTVRADVDAQAIGSPLDAELTLHDMDMAHQLAYSDNADGLDPQITHTLPEDGIYYLLVRAADHPQDGGVASFYEISLDAAPQLEVQGYDVDDDGTGASSGNGDGVIQCGETVELTVALRNESSRDAPDVSATLSTTRTDVSLFAPVQGYADIAGWETASNTKPFVLQVDGDAPEGHAVPLELALQASDGLVRYDALRLPVSCPCRARLGGTDYGTVQSAIDASADVRDVVKVTGRCAEHDVVVAKTLTLQGGWNSDFTAHDPDVYRTLLDAEGLGRVLVLAGGSPVVEDLHLVNGHTSEKGGGVFVFDGEPTLRHNVIVSNTSHSSGGGLFLGGDGATLVGNRIASNATTSGHGGGIATGMYAWVTLEGNTIVRNSAYYNAGALSVGGRTDAGLFNNVVASNACCDSTYSVGGAGIWLGSGDHVLAQNTFAGNEGGDGAAVRLYGNASLTNTIIAGQAVGLVVPDADDTARMEGTLWHANGQDYGGDGAVVIGAVDLHADPAFRDPAGGDYHITAASGALDAGVATGTGGDIDGDPRPSDGDGDGVGEFDVGADEHYPLCITPLVELSIFGPVSGTVDTLYGFTAVPTPSDATGPVTYDWSPDPDLGTGAAASYGWQSAGQKVITVTAHNCGGAGVGVHTVSIEPDTGGSHPLFLPLVLRGS